VPFFAFGFVLYYLLVPRVNRSRDPEMVSLIMFFGVSQALEAIAFLVFGNSERSISGPVFGAAPVSLLGQDYPVSYVGVGTALAAAAGVLSLFMLSGTSPGVGVDITVTAFAVIVLGSLGNPLGTLLGGLIYGLALSFTQVYAASWSNLVPYVLLLAVLLLRPSGLLGRSQRSA
jgi:branched-chain amino acid transport system permease protein